LVRRAGPLAGAAYAHEFGREAGAFRWVAGASILFLAGNLTIVAVLLRS
jgi:hypothetical protein